VNGYLFIYFVVHLTVLLVANLLSLADEQCMMILLMTSNEWCKKWSQHNGGTETASAGVTEANHNTLGQSSRWPSQDSNQASPD